MNANPDQVMAAVIILIASAALVAWAFAANFGPCRSTPTEQAPGMNLAGQPEEFVAQLSVFKDALQKLDEEWLEDRDRETGQTQAFLALGAGRSFSREQAQIIRAECERQRSWPNAICASLQGFSHVMFDCEFRPVTATVKDKTETRLIIEEYHYET